MIPKKKKPTTTQTPNLERNCTSSCVPRIEPGCVELQGSEAPTWTPWSTLPPSGHGGACCWRRGRRVPEGPRSFLEKSEPKRFLSATLSFCDLCGCPLHSRFPCARPPLSFSIWGWCGRVRDRLPWDKGCLEGVYIHMGPTFRMSSSLCLFCSRAIFFFLLGHWFLR